MNKTMMRNMTINEMMNIKDDLDRESLIILADKLQEQVETLEWNNESLRSDLDGAKDEQTPIENELFSLIRNNFGLSLNFYCRGISDYTVYVSEIEDGEYNLIVNEHGCSWERASTRAYEKLVKHLSETRGGY